MPSLVSSPDDARAAAATPSGSDGARRFHSTDAQALGLTVIERGWLSANQVVFAAHGAATAAVVDTGFVAHADQTLALIAHALDGQALGRIVNTHLHSDHCGGNHALQARGTLETWIPAVSMASVRDWDLEALSYRRVDQACPRFVADQALVPGAAIALGAGDWQIHAAPGHDPEAVLLFEPQTRTLIAGDALWEDRLAIIFPELTGEDGFGPARETLDLIERLQPREVIPGHGRPFGDVARALANSRERIAAFERQPEKHAQHAARALLMFHLLEVREAGVEALVDWMRRTPIYQSAARTAGLDERGTFDWAMTQVRRLVDDGVLLEESGRVAVRPQMQ